MAIFKCKMCSGELDVMEGVTVIECEYCGTKQTVPTSKDENLQGLFNRANVLRMKSEFDKAEQLYEKIIEKDDAQAEAYWGLILCKYGIEYVEDPQTFKRIPTCHRTSFDSIIADEDYKSALAHADSVQLGIYEAEAKEIDRLQKEILELSQKEEPYDVFICYKETDNDGKRTQDSVIANDIYHQLTQEGLKVFYAAITLENKLGSAYEPCIFAALNSAKVMLSIGTKPEYFNAVWVKNEWSRFLKIIQRDRSKLLIPCYRDMDAYELPEEFAHLQAQDMSKIGFINDVVRGIKKVVTPEETRQVPAQQTQVTENANGNIKVLLDRGFMSLEDGKWQKADEFFEQVLNFDAKLAEAFLGKLMAELQVRKHEDLKNQEFLFEKNNYFQRAILYGSDELKQTLTNYTTFVKETIYRKASLLMENANFGEAVKHFEQIVDYKESSILLEQCMMKIRESKRKNIIEHSIRSMQTSIAIADGVFVGLKSDGTVIVSDGTEPNWKDIVAVSGTVGLKLDGTVVTFGKDETKEYNVEIWNDIVAISDSGTHTVGLKSDGTVVACGDNKKGACNVGDWRGIVAIAAGYNYTVGLRADGTVVACGGNKYEQCNVEGWSDIIAIAAGYLHTVGLKSDGTVVACGYNEVGVCDINDWNNIIAIATGSSYTVGLKSDGTIVRTTFKKEQNNGEDWEDIVAVFAEEREVVGLKSDGTVRVKHKFSERDPAATRWHNIMLPISAQTVEEVRLARSREFSNKKERLTALTKDCIDKYCIRSMQTYISASETHTVALRANGTVFTTHRTDLEKGALQGWKNLVSVAAGVNYTVGLQADGTVVAFGYNKDKACDVTNWRDIIAISTGGYHTVGLKSDGTVVACGGNYGGCCDVADWSDIVAIAAGSRHTVGLKSDGTVVATEYKGEYYCGQCDVAGWTGIVAIAAGPDHTIALKADGTMVACGDNQYGTCNVSALMTDFDDKLSGPGDIVAIAAGKYHSVALMSDGTVRSTQHYLPFGSKDDTDYGQRSVFAFEDILAISATKDRTIGLKADGTIAATGSLRHEKIEGILLPMDTKEQLDAFRQKQLEKQKIFEEEKRKEKYRNDRVCQHCGGTFKGLFSKACTSCGRQKDY